METPEAPQEGTASRVGRAAEARGLEAATWAGQGDQERGFSLLALTLAAGYFVVLFLPWIDSVSGWTLRVADNSGLLALALVLVELLRLRGVWISRGAGLLAACLTVATGIIGVTTFATLRWGSGPVRFSTLKSGAWLGLVVALLLVALAALRVATLRRSAP